jgi:phosphoglycolate phosphatase
MNESNRIPDLKWLMLDFDGPVCSVFAGYPAPQIAKHLTAVATKSGVTLPDGQTDPHEVLRSVDAISWQAGRAVELALQAAELEAVESAIPTPGALSLIEHCVATDRQVAIVSNNHGPAIQKYIQFHGLTASISCVVGRDAVDVRLMALRAMQADPDHAGFVGDSESDIEAGRLAEVLTIGYANKPGKRERLAAAGADLIVADMESLTHL